MLIKANFKNDKSIIIKINKKLSIKLSYKSYAPLTTSQNFKTRLKQAGFRMPNLIKYKLLIHT